MTKLVNRAKMSTATTGTGAITLGSAVAGFQSFAAAGVSDGDVVRYVIEDGNDWEIGTGTYTASSTTLTRTVDESSNSDAAINLSGSAIVFISPAEADLIQPGGNISELTNDSGFTTNTGTVTSVAATAGTGISISGSPITTSGTLTITNTAPDQTVVLTQGSNVTITGTYPNFTIAATDTNTTYTASTGLTLTGTAFSANIGTDIQAYDATLTSIAALGTAADKLAYTTGVDTWAETAISSFGRSLIDDADAAAARTTLGLGNAATGTIGTDVQAYIEGATGFRNKIINGNFDIWQRGTSFSSYQYGADRWVNAPIGSSMTQSRQSFTLGQTDVPNEPEYFCRSTVTSSAGAGNYALLAQKIEDVRTLAGQTATLSFWAKADASKDIAIEFAQHFGSGGSPSSGVYNLGTTTCSLTTSWQKFTVTVSLPSISGKTLGTGNNSFLIINFWFDAGSDLNARTNSLGQQSGTFDIAQVQLEPGSTATPFEVRSYGQELALCKWYFRKVYVDQFVAVIYVPNGDTRMTPISIGHMRAYPSCSPAIFSNHSINFSHDGNLTNAPTITWRAAIKGQDENTITMDFEYNSGPLDFGGTSDVAVLGSHCFTTFSFDAEL